MIDLHSHILPNLDDGAKNYDISIEMLSISKNEMVDYICATPHFIPGDFEITRAKYEEVWGNLNQLRAINNIPIVIVKGLEIYMHHELPKYYKEKRIWGINDGSYILIELPMEQFPIYTEEVFYELRLLGLHPIIAHPERNMRIIKDNELLYNLLEQGTYVQINSGSLLGNYGKEPKKLAEELVKANAVHFIGSDGHNTKSRSTTIKDAFKFIEKKNPSLAKSIASNEGKLLKSEVIEIGEIKRQKKRGILNLFK